RTRGVGEPAGIVPIEPARGNVILLSASRNQQALDEVPGVTKSNGLFTYTLVQALKTPGVDVVQAMHNVREQVEQLARQANHEQRPPCVKERDGPFFFFPKPGAPAAPAATPAPPPTTPPPPPANAPPRATPAAIRTPGPAVADGGSSAAEPRHGSAPAAA